MPYIEEVVGQLVADLRALQGTPVSVDHKEREPWDEPQPGDGLRPTEAKGKERRGSRYVGPHADPDLVRFIAEGGEVRVAERRRDGDDSKRQPLREFFTKALSEGSASSGGWLVPSDVASDVMTRLRARSAIMRMGPRVVPVRKDLSVTEVSSS